MAGLAVENSRMLQVVSGQASRLDLALDALGEVSQALTTVTQGSHKLNLPIVVASNTNLNVAAGTTLRISDPVTVNSGASVVQSGAGTVLYESTVNVLGGRQSARTLHFFISGFLLLFLIVHVAMVMLTGFRSRMRAMITGGAGSQKEHP